MSTVVHCASPVLKREPYIAGQSESSGEWLLQIHTLQGSERDCMFHIIFPSIVKALIFE